MRLLAAVAFLTFFTGNACGEDHNPNFLDLNEDLISICGSWTRDTKGLPLSEKQVFEAGLCQGYITAAVRLTMTKECAAYVVGQTPGWSISAAIEAINRVWYANSQNLVFRTSSPEQIIEVVVNDVLGPAEGRAAKCKRDSL